MRPDETITRQDVTAALERGWAAAVRAGRAQVEAAADPDFEDAGYRWTGDRFRVDPRRTDDDALDALLGEARPSDTWLDIGAGVGRFALPLALAVRSVVALEPSAEALAILRADAEAAGIGGIETLVDGWPPSAPVPPADVALIAHVGYAVEAIGPFLDALEAAASRRCIAVMGERPMAIAPPLLWPTVHGAERIRTPAMPELLALLRARGRRPRVSDVERAPVVRPTRAGLCDLARRQLRVVGGSSADDRLAAAVDEVAVELDGGWTLDPLPMRIGVIAWDPPAPVS